MKPNTDDSVSALAQTNSRQTLADQLDEIAVHCSHLPVLDERDPAEVVGFDENGLPDGNDRPERTESENARPGSGRLGALIGYLNDFAAEEPVSVEEMREGIKRRARHQHRRIHEGSGSVDKMTP